VAGDHDEEVQREQLELRHRLAVDRGVGQHRGEVVARVLASILGDLREVGERFLQKGQPIRARVARALELGVLDTRSSRW